MDEVEYRSLPLANLEIRLDPETGTFGGYACRFDVTDSYGTNFAPGSFAAGGLDGGTFALLAMHDETRPVGIFTATEQEGGLWIAGKYDETPDGLAARARALSGSASELSVGFVRTGVDPDNPDRITAARLVEVSQVTSRFASQPGAALTIVRAKVKCAQCGKFVERVRCGTCANSDKKGLSVETEHERRMAKPPEGSYEGTIADVCEAVKAWAQETYNPDGNSYARVCVEATFSDHVVATIYVGKDDYTFSFPYVLDTARDEVTLGTATPVEIVETIQPADADETAPPATPDTPAMGPMGMSAEDERELRERKAAALRFTSVQYTTGGGTTGGGVSTIGYPGTTS